MTPRLGMLALLLACCVGVSAQISVGPEIPLGSAELVAWKGVHARPAIASDGDEIFVVYRGTTSTRSPFYAMRFDRAGRVLTPSPIGLVPVTAAVSVLQGFEARMVFAAGHYVLVFASTESTLHAVRVTRNGEVVAQKSVPFPSSGQVELATDGEEIVIATRGDKLLRMRGDLEMAGTIAVTATKGSRGIAFGDGRYVIVTTGENEVTSQSIADGSVSAPVRIAPASNTGGATDVRWTGSAFLAAWTECVGNECLASWTRLSANGAPAGRVNVVDRFLHVTITPLDDETVFLTWQVGGQTLFGSKQPITTYGRRLRSSGAVDAKPVFAVAGVAAAFRTAQGSLFVVDERMRVAMIEAPAAAPLTNPFALTPAVLKPANQGLLDAAVTGTEVVVSSERDWLAFDSVITITARDGSALRELPVESQEVPLATDGRDVFALVLDRRGDLWFFNVKEPGRRTRLNFGAWGRRPDLEWNGREFLAIWLQNGVDPEADRLMLQRLDREGTRLAPVAVLLEQQTYSTVPRVYRSGDDLLVAWDAAVPAPAYRTRTVTRIDRNGNVVGPVDWLTGSIQDGSASLAGNASTEAAVFPTRAFLGNATRFGLELAFRERGGTFTGARTLKIDGGAAWIGGALLSPVRNGFLMSYDVGQGSSSTGHRVALVDEDGVTDDVLLADAGFRGMLLELNPRTFLAIYTRWAEEAPYSGTPSVFARVLTVNFPRKGQTPSKEVNASARP